MSGSTKRCRVSDETCELVNISKDSKNYSTFIGDDSSKPSNWFLYLFYFNVFSSCVSFGMIMPSIWPYINEMGGSVEFMSWCVSIYSLGELLGSYVLGKLYNIFGAKHILLCSILFGIIGSFLYGSGKIFSDNINNTIGLYCVLIGRLLQGVWTGGEQSVESAYIGENISKRDKTKIMSMLSTFGCLGFVLGPAFGTPLENISFTICSNIIIDSNMIPGYFIFLLGLTMFTLTIIFFKKETNILSHNKSINNNSNNNNNNNNIVKPNIVGLILCMFIFLVHFNGFAIQETLTTVLVEQEFNWSENDANYLFSCSGILSLFVFLFLIYISSYISDYILLLVSLIIGFIGHLSLIKSNNIINFNNYSNNNIYCFLIGFSLITIAFPLGRATTLSIFSKILGNKIKQGDWMGRLFVFGAISRIIAPLFAVSLFELYGPTLLFGVSSVLFLLSLVLLIYFKNHFIPYQLYIERIELDY